MIINFQLALLLVTFSSVIIQGCNSAGTAPIKQESKSIKSVFASAKAQDPQDAVETDLENSDEYADYYVLIADTGQQYQALNQAMHNISNSADLKIDTLNRSYRADKKLIALADNDEDEMYAGDYFPRRFAGRFLSIEYLSSYEDNAPEKTMVLIAGIYDTKTGADSAANALASKGFEVENRKTKMFIGCMH